MGACKTHTKARKHPTGFIAMCRCGKVVGAMDYSRTDRKTAGRILEKYLHHGCTLAPRFEGKWSVQVEACCCLDE